MRSFFRVLRSLLNRLGDGLAHVVFLYVFSILPLLSLYSTSAASAEKVGSVRAIVEVALFMVVVFAVSIFLALRSERTSERLGALVYALGFIVGAIAFYALIYQWLGLKIDGHVQQEPSPTDCLYFSIMTWTTVGYGDIAPSDPAKLVAASEALVGYFCMALLLAVILKFMDRRA